QEFTATDVEQALRSEHAVDTVNERVAIYKFRVQEQPRKVVFGIAKLTDLIALHTTYDRKLYEKNIRYFIGSGRRGVNKAIKDTLLHEPENFIYLNNGITLDGNAVKPKGNIRGHTGSKHVAVDGLSVVNGAQTIASAAQFMRENLDADISQAQVMVTIIHFTYCITTLLMAQFKNTITAVEITEQEAFERLISRAFDELRQKFSDSFRTLAFGSAPHAYFKRLSDTARLMQTVWVSHLNLAENPAVIAKQRLQPNDPYNRNLFSYLAKQAQRRQEQNAQAANRQVQQA
ncbi:AIPR family protein, partial [Cronobacter sakazakii]